MNHTHRFFSLLLILVISATVATAQFYDERFGPAPPVTALDKATLIAAARASLAAGVEYLLGEGEDDYGGFILEPISNAFVAGHASFKLVEVRYIKKMIEVPLYNYQYEDGYVLREVMGESQMDPKVLQRVKVKQLVGKKKVGSKMMERLVRDPNGPIVREEKRPTEPVFGDIWPSGYLGQNALVLLALLKCGVPPDNQVIASLTDALDSAVQNFGIPDATWDIAWMAAALSNHPGRRYQRTRDLLLNRLLDGQLTDGPSRGMWGPLCINYKLFAGLIPQEQSLVTVISERAAKMRANPKSKVARKRLDEAEIELDTFVMNRRLVCQQGFRFEMITDPMKMLGSGAAKSIMVPGLPIIIYHELLADLESTSLALYAIQEAAAHKHLPKMVVRPPGFKGRWAVAPDSMSAILARATKAITAAVDKKGFCNERNIHQKIDYFKNQEFMPEPDEGSIDMQSSTTMLSTAQAFAALADTCNAIGARRFMGRYSKQYALARRAQIETAEAFLAGGKTKIPIGRALEPYDLILKFSKIASPVGKSRKPRHDLWSRIAFLLIKAQDDMGRWGADADIEYTYSSSIEQWRAHRKEVDEKLAEEGNKRAIRRQKLRNRTTWNRLYRGTRPNFIKTAYSLIFLQSELGDSAKPLVQAIINGGEEAPDVCAQRNAALEKLIAAIDESEWEPEPGQGNLETDEIW